MERNTPRVPKGYPPGGQTISREQQQIEGKAYRQGSVFAFPSENSPPVVFHIPAPSEPGQDVLVIEPAPYDENGVSVGYSTYSLPKSPDK